jgi:hypothetical protein
MYNSNMGINPAMQWNQGMMMKPNALWDQKVK